MFLFRYRTINEDAALAKDGDTRTGLFPRGTVRAAPSSTPAAVAPPGPAPEQSPPPTAPASPTRGSRVWPTILLVASLALAAYTVLSVYVAGEFTRGAVALMRHNDEASGKATTNPAACLIETKDTVPWGGDSVEAANNCDLAWSTAWAGQDPKLTARVGWWDDVKRWFWRPTSVRQQLSLFWPFLQASAAIVLLVVAAGMIGKGYPGGAFIDERNRLSLARLQQISWTVVLLGGYFVLALFNATLLASFVREKAQLAAGQTDTVIEIPNLFPSMDPTLWAVLGITAVLGPYLSKRIIVSKNQPEEIKEFEVRPIAAHDPIDIRAQPAGASWSDLFMGESVANQNTIDVSRLQHLVITGLLLSAYVLLLLDYVRTMTGKPIMTAVITGAPVFAAMPPVDATFVGLLALSHAGYLAFKALPKDAAAAQTAGGKPNDSAAATTPGGKT